jgi:hypothetical protein
MYKPVVLPVLSVGMQLGPSRDWKNLRGVGELTEMRVRGWMQ